MYFADFWASLSRLYSVADPGRGLGGYGRPGPNFLPFANENMYQNKTFGPPAPDIGLWLNILHLGPPHLNPGSATVYLTGFHQKGQRP